MKNYNNLKSLILLNILNLILLNINIHTFEYVYPIINIDNDTIFYIHQKSLADIELWKTSLNSNEKCLDWRFIPAGFKLLFDQSGFSFIDTDRLRIKKFINRSCRAIEFNDPIHGVSEINWINNDICYFSARKSKRFAIYYGNITYNTLTVVIAKNDTDCLSPRIIKNQLFYIERNSIDRSSTICSMLLSGHSSQVIIDCAFQQVIFLNMLNLNLGWYIEHMPYINDSSEFISFICYKIERSEGASAWSSTKLFKFNIFKKYLFGDDRIYESYIPFLPRTKKTSLYFADIKRSCDGEYYSSINIYDLNKDKFETILTSDLNKIFFAPISVDQKIFYGQIYQNNVHDIPKTINSIIT